MMSPSRFVVLGVVAACASAVVAAQERPVPSPSRAPVRPIVNLLRTVPSQVVVSSVSSPGMSGPSRMVDGRMDTAWNSRPGDLVGAWIAIQLPERVEVTSIKLVPGYVRNYQGRDLFTLNHRIGRVRVSRNGALLGEFDLDIARTDLQDLPVRGGGGIYRIEVVAVQAGSRSDWTETCVTELEVHGRTHVASPSAEGRAPEARVATLAGGGQPAVPTAGLNKRTVRRFQPLETYAPTDELLADGEPRDEEVDRFLQGSHISRIRPLRIVQYGNGAGDRVWFALYYLSPDDESRVRERMNRVRPGPDGEPCEDGEGASCPNLRLARVSIPHSGLPVVDATMEVGNDVCSHKLRFALRDLDADRSNEVYVRLDWSTTPVCPIGPSAQSLEYILNADTLVESFSVDLGAFSGYTCEGQGEGHRVVRDLNRDGHPDFIVRRRQEDFDGAEGQCRTHFTREDWLYDPSDDAWHRREDPAASQ